MGKCCIRVTKYFLFIFNLLFFIFGALIMGFGLWILLDNQSFIAVLQDSAESLKMGSYILIGVGAFTMVLGFLGCLGAISEIRCLLGFYFTCLLLILIAQVVSALLVYFHLEGLRKNTSIIVTDLVKSYQGPNTTAERAWDYIQTSMHCCGWSGSKDWLQNPINNGSSGPPQYPCSCQNITGDSICNTFTQTAIYDTGCMHAVESWLFTNYGIILGISLGVAVIELLAMILSLGLCKSVHQEDYTKVPKY